MELSLDMAMVTGTRAVDGMRKPFVRTFGHGWVGRRLAEASWVAFRAALLHGCGIAVASSHAEVAAEERNLRIMYAARWSTGRIESVVRCAVRNAANAD